MGCRKTWCCGYGFGDYDYSVVAAIVLGQAIWMLSENAKF